MKLMIPAYVEKLMNTLKESGYECYVVGGAVRSLLLGLPVHDYDLTSNALPEQMKHVFASYKTIETGIKHGTLTVLSDHHPIEITTYRKDSAYQDHRHPDAVQFTSAIEEDCARRDFTVNAFCYNDQEGILDFFHGREDLANRTLRCIGNANERFDEDALRILRGIRFAAQLHFQIEENTKKAVFAKKELLSYISMERIHEEMNGFLQADQCAAYLDEYREVFALFLPEIMSVPDWDQTLTQIDRAAPNANVRMAVLLTSCKDPSAVLKRLKYANDDIRQITSLVSSQSTDVSSLVSVRKFLSHWHEDPALYADYRNALDPSFAPAEFMKLCQDVINHHDCISLSQLAVNGNDIRRLGYQGKQISEVLDQLLNDVMEDKAVNEKEQLIAYIKRED